MSLIRNSINPINFNKIIKTFNPKFLSITEPPIATPPPQSLRRHFSRSTTLFSILKMENKPLLPYSSPRKLRPPPPPPLLCPLPEDDEITIPPSSLTPSSKELKDRLIFGSSTSSSLTLSSPKISTHNHPDNEGFDFEQNPPNFEPESPQLGAKFKSNLHRSKTAPAMANINEIVNFPETKPPQFGKPSVVKQGFVLLTMYLILGVIIYTLNRDNFRAHKTHPVVDALYFCIVTMCTIGYGDITPDSTLTKLFSITFVLVGFGFIDILLTGMVSYMLDLQENYLLRNIKGMVGDQESESLIIDVKKGRLRIRIKVGLALGVVVLCIGIGVTFMHFFERLGLLDSVYLSVMSVTTVGYGDRAFGSLGGRIFASIWLLVSTLAVARAFLYLTEARMDKRQRRMVKWVLDQHMTVAQFLAADIDNNGLVSKPEYVIYKLKEMNKVSDKDILVICKQFERLDAGNCGKISLTDLMENR